MASNLICKFRWDLFRQPVDSLSRFAKELSRNVLNVFQLQAQLGILGWKLLQILEKTKLSCDLSPRHDFFPFKIVTRPAHDKITCSFTVDQNLAYFFQMLAIFDGLSS